MASPGEDTPRRRALRLLGAGAVTLASGCLGPLRSRSRAERASADADGPSNRIPDDPDAAATESATTGAGTTEGETTGAEPTAGGAERRELRGVRGAVYFPHRAFNHVQTWANYDPERVDRDVGFAAELGLDAVRVLASYEYWRREPAAFARRFDHFLGAAGERGVRVLPVLFESIGEQPTSANAGREVPLKSPAGAVVRDADRWDGPEAFVRWVAGRYGDRPELLALEVMNEPGTWIQRVEFVRAMLRAARDAHESVPLTVGCKTLANNEQYRDPALDAFQFHYNLPPTAAKMRAALAEATRLSRESGTPVWLTEWQRTLEEPPGRMRPNYASLGETIRESGVDGDFFWQLMLNPAYNLPVRRRGRVNGLFTPEGGVYSAADARALSADGSDEVDGGDESDGSDDADGGDVAASTGDTRGDVDWSTREERPAWVRDVGREVETD